MSVAITTRSARSALLCGTFSALAVLPIVPHVMEDVAYDVPGRFGLSEQAFGWLVGAVLVVQLTAALGAVREHRPGYVGVLVFAVTWVVLALADHWQAFVADEFRGGIASRAAVWGIVATQLLASGFALSAIRLGRRRATFSRTGTFTSF